MVEVRFFFGCSVVLDPLDVEDAGREAPSEPDDREDLLLHLSGHIFLLLPFFSSSEPVSLDRAAEMVLLGAEEL